VRGVCENKKLRLGKVYKEPIRQRLTTLIILGDELYAQYRVGDVVDLWVGGRRRATARIADVYCKKFGYLDEQDLGDWPAELLSRVLLGRRRTAKQMWTTVIKLNYVSVKLPIWHRVWTRLSR
jgi:hypothetical protein